MNEKVIIGDAELWLGNFLEIFPMLQKFDAIVTDPPYGLGAKWQGGMKEWPLAHGGDGHSSIKAWDAKAPDLSWIGKTPAIVWGGNHHGLPPSHGWLVWDKVVRRFTSGHCELAWTNIDQPIRAFNYAHGELATEGKYHPTQKPLPLMKWCLSFLPDAVTILDPFMGSGTTGVACAQLGRKFIGIEIERRYFDIACQRIDNAYRQVPMFPEKTREEAYEQKGIFA